MFYISEPQPFTDGEYTVYEAADFEGIAEKAVLVFTLLKILIKKMILVGKSRKELDYWRAILQVCYFCLHLVSQHAESNLWTSDASRKCAKECVGLLSEKFSCNSVCKLLMLDTKYVLPMLENDSRYNAAVKKTVFGKLLMLWKPHVQRNSWKLNPVTAASFGWCVRQMEFPHLSNFIELILPPVLLFMDDHMVENKEQGTQTLIHILKTSGAEELRWHGRADVIYSALKQQLLTTEDSLLPLTHEALLLVLKILEKDGSELGKTTKYDEIFGMLLQAASHENKLTLRRVHTEPLHIFIEQLGINSVKYTKLLLEIFQEYLEVSDAPSEKARINILLVIKSFIKVAYPRINRHSKFLLQMMIKLLHEVTNKNLNIDQATEKSLIEHCTECIELLKIVDEESVKSQEIQTTANMTQAM